MFAGAQELLAAIKAKGKSSDVEFAGDFVIPHDPLVTDRDRVAMIVVDIWRASGYRFRSVNLIMWQINGPDHSIKGP